MRVVRMREAAPRRPWLSRLGWLVLIWTASVAALAVVAMLFRVMMSLAGLTE